MPQVIPIQGGRSSSRAGSEHHQWLIDSLWRRLKPGENVTIADVAKCHGVGYKAAQKALRRLYRQEMVLRCRVGRVLVYTGKQAGLPLEGGGMNPVKPKSITVTRHERDDGTVYMHTMRVVALEDHEEYVGRLEAEARDLQERLAAAESKEVCTVAHSDEVMAFCPYCRLEAAQAEIDNLKSERAALLERVTSLNGSAALRPLTRDHAGGWPYG